MMAFAPSLKVVVTQPMRAFSESNFKPLESEDEKETKPQTKYDPTAEDPEIDPEEYKRMQSSLVKFSQAMNLGKFMLAQQILDDHKKDIQKYFSADHPANCSVINNQAMLFKLNGKFEEAKEMFEAVFEAYTGIYGEHHTSTINTLINLATTHKDLQEYDLAVKRYEKAIEGRLATEGENSINYAMAKAMAAGAYRELGDYKKAEEYLKDAYIKIAMSQGEENMPAAAILNSMGMLYKR